MKRVAAGWSGVPGSVAAAGGGWAGRCRSGQRRHWVPSGARVMVEPSGSLSKDESGWWARWWQCPQTGVSSSMLVRPWPPSALKGRTWWIWVQAKWARAVGEGAGRPGRAEGEALVGAGDPGAAAEVEGDRVAAEDEGDDPRPRRPSGGPPRRGRGCRRSWSGPGPSWSWPKRSWRVRVTTTRSWLVVGWAWCSARRQASTNASARRASLSRSVKGMAWSSGWSWWSRR